MMTNRLAGQFGGVPYQYFGEWTDRIARGEGEARALRDQGEIAGVARLVHKNGDEHLQALDAQALAALRRRVDRGQAPVDSFVRKEMGKAARALHEKPLQVGRLRHSFVTWATTVGEEVRLLRPGCPLVESEVGSKKLVKKRIWKGRPSGPWITARKVVQYVSLSAFLLFFLLSIQGGLPGDLVNIPLRLDPLLMSTFLLSSRTFLLGSTLALLVILTAVIFGRAWCGWICPLGTTLDIFSLKRWRGKRLPPPESWRKVKYGLLLTTLVAALLGNLTLVGL